MSLLYQALGAGYYPFCICYLLFSFSMMVYAQKISSTRARAREVPLVDILHNDKWLWLAKYHYINNWIIYLEILLLIVTNVKPGTLSNIISTMYLFFRIPSFIITTLPRPSIEPKKTGYLNTPVYKLVFKYITLQDRDPGCDNDLLFSGHTSFLAIFIYHIWYYSDYATSIKIIITLINVTSSITIAMNRRHYSICIWFAYLISWLVYREIHMIV